MELAPVFGSKLYFAQEGETVETITVAPTSAGQPPGSDFATWRELGCIEKLTTDPGLDGGKKIRCFTPGIGYQAAGSRGEKVEPVYTAIVQQIDALLAALAFGADGVDGSDNFVPGSGTGKVKGWIKLQGYVEDESTPSILLQAWVELSVPGGAGFEEAPTVLTVRIEMQRPTSGTVQGTLANNLAS